MTRRAFARHGVRTLSLAPMAHPRTFAVTALYGAALLLGYAALHVVAEDE